ncbi:MAG: SPOR domain-containing protein [Candidatus Competibacteraceae bacterium]|nr:SPOR domain-containing protein [Candidatus Competibacteraceae bacterium]
MASLSWKPLALFSGVLVIAIGLQAGSINMMINLSQPDEPAAKIASADHAPPAAHPSKPEVPVTDPPHLANVNHQAEPAHSPEAHAMETSPAVESHAPPVVDAPPMPSMPRSNIPPPIELDPEPHTETHTEVPHGASSAASLEAATLTSRIPPPIELESTTPAGNLLEPDWLEGRNPDHYTVQLYSGKDLDRLREIAAADSIAADGPKAYFTSPSRSGPWYSLVIGDYPDFAAAQKIATEIAARSGSIKPWIRRFSEIQARMR